MESKIKQDTTFWYFAIGSMCNPTSMGNRGFDPIESVPGILLDHKIHWFGVAGMAEAVEAVGESFHGILHRVDRETMQSLDEIEAEYIRKDARSRLYDGSELNVTVYCRPEGVERGTHVDNLPDERYIDVICKGCAHYGVDTSYMEQLRIVQQRPRKKPNEFDRISVPDGLPVMTEEELALGDGQDGRDALTAINGKVRKYIGGEKHTLYKRFTSYFGIHMEPILANMLYEPLYGCPDKLEDFTREHCAYLEDFVYLISCKPQSFEVVGLIEQKYAD